MDVLATTSQELNRTNKDVVVQQVVNWLIMLVLAVDKKVI